MTPLEIHDQLCEALINTKKLQERALKLDDQIDLQCEVNQLLEALVEVKKIMPLDRPTEDSPLVSAAEDLIRKVDGNVVHWRQFRVTDRCSHGGYYIACGASANYSVRHSSNPELVTCEACRVLMTKEELEA